MGIKYGWLVDQKVMYTAMYGVVNNKEYQQWADETKVLYDAVPHDRFHILVDCTELEKTPMLNDLLNIHFHKKRDWIIAFGMQNQLVKFAASMVLQVTRTNMKLVDTLDESLAILGRVDLGLDLPDDKTVNWINDIRDQSTDSAMQA